MLDILSRFIWMNEKWNLYLMKYFDIESLSLEFYIYLC